jgi:hypothetical protein
MTEPLLPGMYQEFSPRTGRFGLRGGQMRGGISKVIHNGGWHNGKGQKLGFGDLDTIDISRIARELEEPEVFTVLSERNSYWRYVSNPGVSGPMNVDEALVDKMKSEGKFEHAAAFGTKDETAEIFPEHDFVIFNAEFTIVRNGILFRTDRGRDGLFLDGIEDIPRQLNTRRRELEQTLRYDGQEAYDTRKTQIWPGDDIQEYAANLDVEVLEPVDFVLKVTDLTTQ